MTNMDKKYYIMENGTQVGPFTLDDLRQRGIRPDTLIWCHGMTGWEQAMSLDELSDLFFSNTASPQPQGQSAGVYPNFGGDNSALSQYFAMINGQRIGPDSPLGLVNRGLRHDTPVWRDGLPDWVMASTQPEIMEVLNGGNQQPYGTSYPSGNPQPHNPYPGVNPQGGYPQPGNGMPVQHTNWLPWAIVATVLGLCNCLGIVFGIIGIVNANNANEAYARGDYSTARSCNGTARVMTIIGLVLGGLALISYVGVFNIFPWALFTL